MPRPPEHDCPCCTSGQIDLHWADRSTSVYLDDHEHVADTVVACAIDHDYDRGSGVPYGLPDKTREALLPIVANHLSAVRPDWAQHTVRLDEAQHAALRAEILSTLRALAGSVEAVPFMLTAIGNDLRAAREHAGLTQIELAKKLHKTQSLVNSVETGSVRVGERYIVAVLKACGLPPDWKAPAPPLNHRAGPFIESSAPTPTGPPYTHSSGPYITKTGA